MLKNTGLVEHQTGKRCGRTPAGSASQRPNSNKRLAKAERLLDQQENQAMTICHFQVRTVLKSRGRDLVKDKRNHKKVKDMLSNKDCSKD